MFVCLLSVWFVVFALHTTVVSNLTQSGRRVERVPTGQRGAALARVPLRGVLYTGTAALYIDTGALCIGMGVFFLGTGAFCLGTGALYILVLVHFALVLVHSHQNPTTNLTLIASFIYPLPPSARFTAAAQT